MTSTTSSSSSANAALRYAAAARCLRAALALRERLVGDVPDEVLQEAVLAVLGRARVGLHAEHLLAHERREQRLELGLGEARRAPPARRCVNVLPSTAASWSSRRSSGDEAVEPGGDQRVQRLRHLERVDLADRPVDGALLDEQAAVEQHPHRLDRVERDALGAGEDLLAQRRRADRARARPGAPPSPAARAARGRASVKLRCPAPQVGRRSSSSGRASVITKSGWLRDHSSRYSTKSSRLASAHCMSSNASTVG